MFNRCLILFIIFVGIALAALSIITIGQTPSTTQTTLGADGDVLVFQADRTNLQACGAHATLRHIEAPEAFTPTPTNTPDPTAPTATPTSTPGPAPSIDRVGFPENYATEFHLLFVFDRPDRQVVRVVCGNDIAAQHQEGEPFAYGSVLLMISYAAKLDADGQPILDENGHYIAERVVGLNVQRKGEGFGAAYGDNRAGEWEFVAYNADGSYQNPPETTNFCAECHRRDGGESVDYALRMNLYHDGAVALIAPTVSANEVSIYLNAFHEPVLEVKVGTTVTWYNDDEAEHIIMAAQVNADGMVVPADEPLFRSMILPSVNVGAGARFRFTFDEAGEYLYLCPLHANEVGRIIVTE